VLLAVLRAELVVKMYWLSSAQLLDAIAVSQVTPGPFFYGGDLHRVSAGRMERCGTGNRRDVLAGVCVRGSDGKTFAEIAEVGGGEGVSGWSECSGGGVDGGGGVAVCACGNREHAGNCVAGFLCGAGVPVQSEFRVVDVGGSDCWDCAARDRLGLSEEQRAS
jgi:hypothetical protein